MMMLLILFLLKLSFQHSTLACCRAGTGDGEGGAESFSLHGHSLAERWAYGWIHKVGSLLQRHAALWRLQPGLVAPLRDGPFKEQAY